MGRLRDLIHACMWVGEMILRVLSLIGMYERMAR